MISKPIIITLIISALLLLTVASCKKTELIPPQALPVTTLYSNLSYLEPVTYTDENKIYAAEILKIWKNYINDSIAYITDYYQKISVVEAIYQTQKTWLWEINIEKDTTNINAKLFSITDTDSSNWKLYLTLEGAYTNLQVLKGISDNNYFGGNWTISKLNTQKELSKFLTVNWS